MTPSEPSTHVNSPRQRLRAWGPGLAVSAVVVWMVIRMFPRLFKRIGTSDYFELAASIQDDSFYYLVPAFRFKTQGFFTFDGLTSTYGFQPAYEVLLTAYAFFFADFESFLRGTMKLGLVLHALTAVMIALLVLRTADARTRWGRWLQYALAAGAGLFYLSRGTVVLSAMTCKENVLAAGLLAGVLLLVTQDVEDTPKRHRLFSVLTGAGVGVLLLCRILPTTLASVGLVTLIALFRWRKPGAFFLAFAMPMILWGAYAVVAFGHVVPMSARVKTLGESVDSPWRVLATHGRDYMKATFGFAVGDPGMWLPQRDGAIVLPDAPATPRWAAITAMALVVLGGAGGAGLRQAFRARSLRLPQHTLVVSLLAVLTLSIIAIYPIQGILIAMRRPGELFYYMWYVYDLPVLVAAALGAAAVVGLGRVERFVVMVTARKGFEVRTTLVSAGAVVGVLAVLLIFGQRIPEGYKKVRQLKPYATFDQSAGTWQHTMLRAGLWLKQNVQLQPGERVACFSCGALGFLLPDHVLNLDGLANDDAARSRLTNPSTIEDYIAKVRPRYYIDVHVWTVTSNPRIQVRPLQVLPFSYEGGYLVAELTHQ
ncbi:hypothetical protein [Myxococcus sp. SDU36]|uniref:hypothetical protein n=1 Tax=Myxococcus sp. SDU36 TaxID=2831967 RepID=UPI0025439D02|nr:hypothetical protein [Myxococcus sp. SDU36]WIG92488.1 hypothetical protein KGD87_17685 [Myxococcus sp. SDU36]